MQQFFNVAIGCGRCCTFSHGLSLILGCRQYIRAALGDCASISEVGVIIGGDEDRVDYCRGDC